MFFFLIIFGLPLLDLLWWRWADQKLRPLPRAAWWRGALAAFIVLQLGFYGFTLLSRVIGLGSGSPKPLLAGAYLWHIIILPLTMAMICAWEIGRSALLALGRWRRRAAKGDADSPSPSFDPPPLASPGLTRRQLLAGAVAAVPPLLTAGTVTHGLTQLHHFRVRRLTVALPALPPSLDGMTIAHLSDVHVGRFTYDKLLSRIVEGTNALKPDLVLFTGDLIDFTLADLPQGIDLLRKLDPRYGLFICEGNHDLFEDRVGFETRVRAAGIPLLLDEAQTARVRGEDIQVLGLMWGRLGLRREAALESHAAATLGSYDPRAFAILLAHHPHAYDAAAIAGVPLTLAGHTHGGQLMLSENVGPGPMMYKYWSGLYRHAERPDTAVVVSNGTGNWFPLRINAPAEIIHLTLRAG